MNKIDTKPAQSDVNIQLRGKDFKCKPEMEQKQKHGIIVSPAHKEGNKSKDMEDGGLKSKDTSMMRSSEALLHVNVSEFNIN